MDIAIFGAGAAGLMTAITLHNTGHKVRVFERSCRNHEMGMGFILVPECVADLHSFGIEVPGVTVNYYLHRDSQGAVLRQTTMPPGARGLRRRDLIAALIQALPAENILAFGAELARLDAEASGEITCATLNCPAGNTLVNADLYVSADGIASFARRALFPGWPAPAARVKELVGVVKCRDTVQWANNNFNKFHAAQGGIALGVLPVDTERVVWYLQFDAHRFPAPEKSAEARHWFVAQLAGDWADPIPHLIAKTDFSQVHLWQPVDTDLIPRFSQGNLVLVGDAAHPFLPFTSQGVSAAVRDAVVLAKVLKDSPDLAAALSSYSRARYQPCKAYVTRGRELMQHFLDPQGIFIELPIA